MSKLYTEEEVQEIAVKEKTRALNFFLQELGKCKNMEEVHTELLTLAVSLQATLETKTYTEAKERGRELLKKLLEE